ncbi:hypothetical protein HPP92_028498 [Vanilla planifolia]|uniref:WW domain-containing protein n=1 Tax=Vanilla planifolia TaxID=51239 RepID=A0A835P7R1_VANPL|nr:hypothetical protein HPP92_028498 [Vanilla planifolia]KAG0447137.1 hypothetical protein HPP92_028497 [Vanilla planifolia]
MTVTCPSHADHLIPINQASSQSPSFPSDDFSVPPPPEENGFPLLLQRLNHFLLHPPPENEMDSSHEPTEPFLHLIQGLIKVSSLVDKWKAAKEELHGEEEEEPEDALDALQKKRQKEIEEWQARQVVMEKAQDNANFVPLGGDWCEMGHGEYILTLQWVSKVNAKMRREQVKRRRAAVLKAKEEAHASRIYLERKKDPESCGAFKDLPTGWQAHWDESTKQFTMEISNLGTTWTQPTK